MPQIILSEKLDVSQYDELQIWLLDRFQEIIAMQEIDVTYKLTVIYVFFNDIARRNNKLMVNFFR